MLGLDAADLAVLVKHLPDFVVVLDEDARLLWVNHLEATLEIEDVLGKRIDEFVHEDGRAATLAAVQKCLRTGEPDYYEVLGYAKGGDAAYSGYLLIPLPTATNTGPRVLMLSSDLTQRHLAQQALAHSELRFRQLVESSPDWILIINRARVISYINQDPILVTGFSRTEIIGTCLDEFIDPDDLELAIAVIEEVFEIGGPGGFESGAAFKPSRYRVQVVPLPPDPQAGPQVLTIATDITAEHRARAQREAMLAELDHRVKNTLATVTAIAEQTLLRATSFEGFKDAFTGRLRSLARAHEALVASKWENVSLAEVLRVVITPITGRAGLLAEGSANPAMAAAVVTPLALALHELATNAVKHGALSVADGSITIHSRMHARDRLELEWREQGRSSLTRASGQGLGLLLVRGLIEHELGGRLSLADEPSGRRYLLEVPLIGVLS